MQPEQSSINAAVIGATGGIGFAVTHSLLKSGYIVLAGCRHPDQPAAKHLSSLADEFPGRLHIQSLDVTDTGSIECFFEQGHGRPERLNLVMNCSGVLHTNNGMRPEKRLEDVAADNLALSFAVNATAPLLIARYALPLLQHDERAVLANISARVGSITDNRIGGWYAYRAAKAAQNMITRTLALELNRRCDNVICVGLHPGTVDTNLSRPFQANVPSQQLHTPEQAADDLLQVVNNLRPADSGKVFAWDGREIPP